MRLFGRFACVVMLCLTASVGVLAQADSAARLVGFWREYGGSDNLVNFTEKGTVSMYLRKGEVGDLHTLDGTWKLDGSNGITMTFSANGKSFSQSGRLSFRDEDMILTDEQGTETRHRRHTGP